MSILKMKMLVLLERHKQVTAVAQALGLKQPTVSFHMKKMEAEWGVPLFETRMGRIKLTRAGQTLHYYAARMVELHEEAEARIGELRAFGRDRLVVGCTGAAAAVLARTQWLSRIGDGDSAGGGGGGDDSAQSLRTIVTIGAEDELYRGLLDGSTDLLLCGRPPDEAAAVDLHAERLLSSPLRLVYRSGAHPFPPAAGALSLALSEQPLLALSDAAIQDSLRTWEASRGRRLNIAATLDSVELALGAVRGGSGYAIVPACALPETVDGAVFDDVPVDLPEWRLYGVWRGDHWNVARLQRLLQPLRQ